MKITCPICPHHCSLLPGETGFCRARANDGDRIVAANYGLITSLALDPIEKKPLYHFFPGSFILSAGSFGCNLRCPFCQNYSISQADSSVALQKTTPQELANFALDVAKKAEQGNLGLAFTYNEPLVGYEFVLDTAKILKGMGLKTVLVTNGMIEEGPLKKLLPYIDALNIDLKAFNRNFYAWVGGDLDTALRTITLSTQFAHVEVTTLIIPGKNDSEEEMEREAKWLANISPDLPLHISRYFPRYQCETPATEVALIHKLAAIAEKHLRFVHLGNV